MGRFLVHILIGSMICLAVAACSAAISWRLDDGNAKTRISPQNEPTAETNRSPKTSAEVAEEGRNQIRLLAFAAVMAGVALWCVKKWGGPWAASLVWLPIAAAYALVIGGGIFIAWYSLPEKARAWIVVGAVAAAVIGFVDMGRENVKHRNAAPEPKS